MATLNLDPYPAFFLTLVERSIHTVLARLQTRTDGSISEEERALILNVLDYGLAVQEIWSTSRGLVMATVPLMEQTSYWDDWLLFLERALTMSKLQQDREVEAELLYRRGVFEQLRTDLQKADQDFSKSASIFLMLGDNLKAARALNRQAYVARLRQDFSSALTLVEQATSLLSPHQSEQGYSAFVRGVVAFDQRDWVQAEIWLRRSLDIWTHHGDQRMVARSLCNLGPALQVQQRYPEALVCYQEAEKVLAMLGDHIQLALTRMNMGIVYSLTDENHLALSLFQQAEPIFRGEQATLYLAQLYNNLGFCYRRLQQWEAAQAAYEQSIVHYKALGNRPRLANAMDGLGLALAGLNLHDQAVTIWKEALTILASLPVDPGVERVRAGLVERLSGVYPG
ncbi:MAG: tetratricopeptide repeat protein [Caldilineaceae bacterium]|nr:tetratricopeptide repeat protein [Caldilineaceae bacterium]